VLEKLLSGAVVAICDCQRAENIGLRLMRPCLIIGELIVKAIHLGLQFLCKALGECKLRIK